MHPYGDLITAIQLAIIVSCSSPNTSDLPVFLYKSVSKEQALVIKEFPDWVELWVNLLYKQEMHF